MPGRIPVTAGALIRRSLRRALQNDPRITFTEDKGLLDSHFVIHTPTLETHRHWEAAIARWKSRLDAAK